MQGTTSPFFTKDVLLARGLDVDFRSKCSYAIGSVSFSVKVETKEGGSMTDNASLSSISIGTPWF